MLSIAILTLISSRTRRGKRKQVPLPLSESACLWQLKNTYNWGICWEYSAVFLLKLSFIKTFLILLLGLSKRLHVQPSLKIPVEALIESTFVNSNHTLAGLSIAPSSEVAGEASRSPTVWLPNILGMPVWIYHRTNRRGVGVPTDGKWISVPLVLGVERLPHCMWKRENKEINPKQACSAHQMNKLLGSPESSYQKPRQTWEQGVMKNQLILRLSHTQTHTHTHAHWKCTLEILICTINPIRPAFPRSIEYSKTRFRIHSLSCLLYEPVFILSWADLKRRRKCDVKWHNTKWSSDVDDYGDDNDSDIEKNLSKVPTTFLDIRRSTAPKLSPSKISLISQDFFFHFSMSPSFLNAFNFCHYPIPARLFFFFHLFYCQIPLFPWKFLFWYLCTIFLEKVQINPWPNNC